MGCLPRSIMRRFKSSSELSVVISNG
jgi:hypothetical protein